MFGQILGHAPSIYCALVGQAVSRVEDTAEKGAWRSRKGEEINNVNLIVFLTLQFPTQKLTGPIRFRTV